MIDNIMNEYGYSESGIDNILMNNVLDKDNTIGLGKNTTSKTEGSWPFDQTNHSNGSTPMGTLDILSFYKKEPTPPTPTGDYMYFEAAEANSTVSMVSTLATAPNLEYSTDGETWQEWQHTTEVTPGEEEGDPDTYIHTFDTLTLGAIGDKVYLRGDNPNGFAYFPEGSQIPNSSYFTLTGKVNAGGNIMSLMDTTMVLTVVPQFGFFGLFRNMGGGDGALLTHPAMVTITAIGHLGCAAMYIGQPSLTAASDMPALITIGDNGCASMYTACNSLTAAVGMPILTNIENSGCKDMYSGCSFDMSDDGTTLNFDFPQPPITTTGFSPQTYATAYDVAEWMGNTNGFNV